MSHHTSTLSPHEQPSFAHPINVLHVDDDPAFAKMAAEFLTREDEQLNIHTETCPADALEYLRDGSDEVDCIVSDYDMPERTGLDLLKLVREAYGDIPFILFTGKGSEEIASEAISAGVDEYLQKGSGTDKYTVLANRIRTLTAKRRTELDLQTRVTQQQLVAELGQRALSSNNLQELFEEAVGIVADTLDNEYAKVLDWRPARDDLQLVAGVGWQAGLVGNAAVGDDLDSQAGYTLHSEDPVIVDDLRTEERFSGPSLLLDHDVVSGISVIIGNVDNPWGVLGTHTTDRKAFTKDDVNFVQAVANVLATAIERRNLEREQEDYQEYTERLVNTIDDLFFVHDGEGNLQRWNDAFTEITGYSDEEMASMHGLDFVRAEDEQRTGAAIEQVFESGSAQLEVPLSTKSGETIPYEFRAVEVEHPDGELRLVGVGRDISERKRHERELETEREWRTEIFEGGPDAVFITDQDANFVDINEAAINLTGYEREELLAMRIPELHEEADLYAYQEYHDRILDGEQITTEAKILRADGAKVPVELNNRRIEIDGEIYIHTVARDITKRKRKERQLAQQLAQFEHFGSVLAHDTRTPLTTAEGYLRLARETDDEKYLKKTEIALARLEEIIEDMSEVMKQGELVTEITAVELDTCLRDVWNSQKTAAATLTVQDSRQIQADETAMKRLAENLFKNAIDHGGEDVVVTVGTLPDGFYIEDDGSGIQASDREQVFEAGFSGTGDSRGFGLTSVQQIVMAHGWEIEVTDSEKGARFDITGVQS